MTGAREQSHRAGSSLLLCIIHVVFPRVCYTEDEMAPLAVGNSPCLGISGFSATNILSLCAQERQF